MFAGGGRKVEADTCAGLKQKVWGVGVRGDTKSLLLNNSLMLAVRIALGVALVLAALMIMGSTRASAATEPELLSGILSPAENVVDKTVDQVPVVEAVPIVDPVPKVESVNAPPVIVLPVVEVVGPVTEPVLGTVGPGTQTTAPVVQIVPPAVDPVAVAGEPVEDGVAGGVAGGVGNVGEHVVPSPPDLPGAVPVVPAVPLVPVVPGVVTPHIPVVAEEVPGVVTPDIPAVCEEALNTPSIPVTPASEASATSAAQSGPETAVRTPVIVAYSIPADGLEVVGLIPRGFRVVDAPALSGAGPSGSGTHSEACSSMAGQTVGLCAPEVAPSVGSAPSGAGSGGMGGSSGTAANENFSTSVIFEAGCAAISNAGWPLPASMPSNPGSSPD